MSAPSEGLPPLAGDRPSPADARRAEPAPGESRPAGEDATARLALLEQHVQRAIELIGTLRHDNARLSRERAELFARATALENEVAALRHQVAALGRLGAEHRRLVEERRQLLGQVESVLKDLARIEGL